MKNKRTINYKIPINQLHYLAGIIDSSSSFFLSRHACGRKDPITNENALRWVGGIVIQNTNPILSKLINKLIFLGDATTHITRPGGHNVRSLKGIRISGPALNELLPRLIPILIIKREHAEILMEFRRSIIEGKYGQQNPIPAAMEEYRNELRKRMAFLNSNEHKDIIASI